MVPCHRAAHGYVLALHVHAMHYGITFMVNTLMLVGCMVSAQCGAGGFFVFSLQDRRSDHGESCLRPWATTQWGFAFCLQGSGGVGSGVPVFAGSVCTCHEPRHKCREGGVEILCCQQRAPVVLFMAACGHVTMLQGFRVVQPVACAFFEGSRVHLHLLLVV